MAYTSGRNIDDFIQLSGPLFEAVQQSRTFADSKTFVDAVPTSNPQKILQEYETQRRQANFDLEAFVRRHFHLPREKSTKKFQPPASMDDHIEQLWEYLSRQPDEGVSELSTLIPLPYPYIVPGGRFREIYYWDTYFTAEGLAASGRLEMVENLARNFAWLIDQAGHMPNGNRYYYLSRSQPPFFVFLVDLLARKKSLSFIQQFLPALETEYQFWMDGQSTTSNGQTHRRIVNVDGTVLNRYWDDRPLPREEAWREDREIAQGQNSEQSTKHYRNLRAGAESGWDYSSRWLADGKTLKSIPTTDILPVDLNALLYFLETKLGESSEDTVSKQYLEYARARRQHFNAFFWDDSKEFYFDYDWEKKRQTEIWSLAGTYPLFVGLASERQAESVAQILEERFLEEGGLVCTLHETGQQWDYPNGWAPLQWIAVRGLLNYGHEALARTIARRWLELNESVFDRTGKMMEKYNVCDTSLRAGGGEYPLQDGFGWTNGVAVALKKLFNLY